EAAGVAGEGAVGADHPVAREHDRDRVAAAGQPDRARRGVGPPQPSDELAVRRGLAVPDPAQLLTHPAMEVAPRGGERELELLQVPVEVRRQLPTALRQQRVSVVAVATRTTVTGPERRELDRGDRAFVLDEAQLADG